MSNSLVSYLTFLKWKNNPKQFFTDITSITNPPGLTQTKQQYQLFNWVEQKVDRILLSACNGAGKTFNLALLAILVSCVWSKVDNYPYKTLLVSGSWQQAKVLHDFVRDFLRHPILEAELRDEATATRANFLSGGNIRSFTATEGQIFGQHPDLMCIDEAELVEDKIIEDSYSRVGGSPLSILIYSGTPETEHYFSKFIGMYENTEDYSHWRRLNWSAFDCPWISLRTINEARNELSKSKFKAKWMGLPDFEAAGALFDTDKIRKEVRVSPDKCQFNKNEPSSMGIDFGFRHPTVMTIFQQEREIYFMVHGEEHKEKTWDYVKNRIPYLCNEYNVEIIHADANDPWRIEELQRMDELQGVQLDPVNFRGVKAQLQFRLQGIIKKDHLKIPDIYSTALKELSLYTETTKLNDDWVDSIQLGVRSKLRSETDPWYFATGNYDK